MVIGGEVEPPTAKHSIELVAICLTASQHLARFDHQHNAASTVEGSNSISAALRLPKKMVQCIPLQFSAVCIGVKWVLVEHIISQFTLQFTGRGFY